MRMLIFHLDAFTTRAFAGNPAAVMLMESFPDDDLLQRIAAENNLSETAFLVKEDNDYRLRWFTPTVEVPLCGHELGHFLAARTCRVPVTGVGFGWGPKLLAFRFRKVDYQLRALPIGAYVRMDMSTLQKRPLLQQLFVLLAGIAVNFILSGIAWGTFFGTLNLVLAIGNLFPLYQQDGWKSGMQHFNLNLQYQFLSEFVFELGYVGTAGTKLLQFRDLNQPIFVPGTDQAGNPLSTPANKELRRPYAGYSTIAQSVTNGRSNYHEIKRSE